jgi:hypothetical protein
MVISLLTVGGAILIAAAVLFYEPICNEVHYGLEIRELRRHDPVREAEVAWNRGDFRFMGIYGVGLSCPGVPDQDHVLIEKHGVNPIQGTSDCFMYFIWHNQSEFQSIACDFATRYNREILARAPRPPSPQAQPRDEH